MSPSLLRSDDAIDPRQVELARLGLNYKDASVELGGLLQVVSTNHLVVSVPTAFVRGLFSMIDEPGLSLPYTLGDGFVKPCIVVMTPEEVEKIGGASVIRERGRTYSFRLGALRQHNSTGIKGISSCWAVDVVSSSLVALRRSYGLDSKLAGRYGFSILVACRKAGVLRNNEVSRHE